MPLLERKLRIDTEGVPPEVRSFIREAERRIESFRQRTVIPGFVPSDFITAYCVLRAVAGEVPCRSLLCEWGSGFGVISGMAAMLDFDVLGIEIKEELVDAARQLASDFDLPVQFACGSFIPDQATPLLKSIGDFSWLETEGVSGYEETGLAPEDFQVIFCYPWPDEESFTRKLFERYAARGAILIIHHGGDAFGVYKKK